MLADQLIHLVQRVKALLHLGLFFGCYQFGKGFKGNSNFAVTPKRDVRP